MNHSIGDNPIDTPGSYSHDTSQKWENEFWAIKIVSYRKQIENLKERVTLIETRWLTSKRCFAGWVHRIRFLSRTEAMKYLWDTRLCYLPKEEDKELGISHVVKLIHVTPNLTDSLVEAAKAI